MENILIKKIALAGSRSADGPPTAFKRGPARPRANWIGTVKKDLRKMTLTWEEAVVAALDRQEWRRSVAQCIHGYIHEYIHGYSHGYPRKNLWIWM